MSLINLYYEFKNILSGKNHLKDEKCKVLLNKINITEIGDFIIQNKEKYNRKVVISDQELEIVIITWLSGQQTSLHSHPGECLFKLLKGSLKEKFIDNKGQEKNNFYSDGNLGYIHNDLGIHQVLAIEDSVSIHIYSPPIPIS